MQSSDAAKTAECAGESRCRQYEESSCKYGGHCNFMHIKRPSRDVCKRLGIRTTYEAARGGGGGGGGGGYGGDRGYGMIDLRPPPLQPHCPPARNPSRARSTACAHYFMRGRVSSWTSAVLAVQRLAEVVAV